MATVVGEPGAGNVQVRTWFSMHLPMTGSSPVELALETVPFAATFAVTVMLALDFCSPPPRSQHERFTPA